MKRETVKAVIKIDRILTVKIIPTLLVLKTIHKPIIVNKGYIYVISTRLGFQDSDIVKIKL